MPPPSAASSLSSSVLMHFHDSAGLPNAAVKAFSAALSPPKPSCWCRAGTTASTSFLSSPAGNWARLATSCASRVSRSLVVMRALSSEGNRCEKGLVSKSGSTCSKSVMGRWEWASARLCGTAWGTRELGNGRGLAEQTRDWRLCGARRVDGKSRRAPPTATA
jgi:hypothetical protein